MKRLIAFFMMFVLMFTLTACGSNSAPAPTTSEPDTNKPTDEKIVIRVGFSTEPDSHYGKGTAEFERLVEEYSNGKVDVQLFASATLGNERDMIEGISLGIETDEEKTSVMKSFKDTLRAGDVIVTVYNTNGHTMLYAGNDIFYHCSSNGKKGSYNYQQRHDNIYERGAISNISSSVLFSPEINGTPSRSYLFRDVNLKFCILRPLSDVGAITFSTQKRVEGLKNIRSSVTSSHPEGKSIRLGEEITYNVEVVNLDTSERNIKIMYKKEEISFCLKAGESTNKLYTEVIKSDMVDGRYICKPEITVNNMGIHVPKVIFDNNSLHDFLLPAPEVIIKDLFIKQNKDEGEVYCLRKISHFSSMLVPGLFGGFGVITPEIVQSPDIRTHRITISSLQQGDLIIYKDSMDAPAVGVKYYGDGNLDFAEDTEVSTFIDSLFGRFCFCVIRQSLYKAQGEGGEYAF
jgi:predicted small lipoprotein YifL